MGDGDSMRRREGLPSLDIRLYRCWNVRPQYPTILIADGTWDIGEMANAEELDPNPFISLMNRLGLATRIQDDRGLDAEQEVAGKPQVTVTRR